jgi:hypothetical protein
VLNEPLRGERVKHRHIVHALERRHHAGPISLSDDRPSRPFESPDGSIAVDGDDEQITEPLGSL